MADALGEAIPNTLLLMVLSIAASFAVGIAVGVAQAQRAGRVADRALGAVAMVFYAMPDFWLALLALYVFSYKLGWFPLAGMHDPGALSLPRALGAGSWTPRGTSCSRSRTFTLLTAAGVARFQRAAMLEVMSQDYVRTARAKGLPEHLVIRRHVLRNALLPVITLLGLYLPALLGGAVLIERVFSWPGMGMLATTAIGTRDYPLLIATTIVSSVLVVAGSLLADLLYAVGRPARAGRLACASSPG